MFFNTIPVLFLSLRAKVEQNSVTRHKNASSYLKKRWLN